MGCFAQAIVRNEAYNHGSPLIGRGFGSDCGGFNDSYEEYTRTTTTVHHDPMAG